MRSRICLLAALVIAVFITGCPKPLVKPQYDRPLPAGELALRKITNPEDIPDFTEGCYNVAGLQKAIDNSLDYLKKKSTRLYFPYGTISHRQVVESLEAFKKLTDSGLRGRELNNAIREQFDVYISVGYDNKGTVLFTGYYTPIFDGSLTATEKFKCPLYSQPEDLVKDPSGETLGKRGPDGKITPYPTRSEIENSNILKGKELVWLSDPFETYIAHVQGSAKIKLPDGKVATVGYAANNGYQYSSISEKMVNDGKISKDQLSLSAMIDYFRKNPNMVSAYTQQQNPRFIFFKKDIGTPHGSLNEPVTAMRTIATDKSIYPRASLAFISTTLPRVIGDNVYHDPYCGFALDQDTGGAIRAPGRCDIYLGEGDTAGKLAGQTYREGRLYYLFLKPSLRDLRQFQPPALSPVEPQLPAVNPEPQTKK